MSAVFRLNDTQALPDGQDCVDLEACLADQSMSQFCVDFGEKSQ